MVKVDTPYIIGVIREREKLLLGTDEYTRLIGAASYTDATHVLAETPYGSVTGLDRHLQDVQTWLVSLLDDEHAVWFIAARADALNAATALVRHRLGNDDPGELAPLGSFSPAVLHSTIWHDLGWEALPPLWQTALRTARQPEQRAAGRITAVVAALHAWYSELAHTPLTRALLALWQERLLAEQGIRPLTYDTVTEQLTEEGGVRLAASFWDRTWDTRMIALLRRARGDVVGIDPILSFWFAKELEVKTIRILLAGKAAGLPSVHLQQLVRPSYLTHA